MSLRDAAHHALADIQDWNELEALRESLREHMAEIHRLRLVCRQALAELEKEARSADDWLIMMKSARTLLRAALADEQQGTEDGENTMQPTGGVHSRISDCAYRGVEAVTDCHKTVRDKLPLPPDHIADTNKMVEPVAYITGYFDGKCVIKPVEHVVFPAGMALYRSPPTCQESRQVEPVAYMSMCFSNGQTKPHSKTLFWPEQYTGRTEPVDAGAWGEERVVPLYTATPKRKPLTDEQIEFRFGRKPTKYMMFLIRSTERAHGIGGEE